MKKLVAVVLVMVLAVTCLFTGCGNGTKKTASGVEVSGVDQFPIVKEKVELDVFVPKPSMMSDVETNEFTRWYEEKTGVHINWEIAQGDVKQAVNIKLASGDYPDVFLGCGFSNALTVSYGEQGVFIDLTDLINEHCKYIPEMLEKRPDIKEAITLNGKIYALPLVNETLDTIYQNKMWVYQPWLEKLGIEEPTTTEEFYQMLKAFKEQDPNGNGKKDEVPLAARGIPGNSGIELYLMNAFQYTSETRMYIDNGKVKFCADTEDYREGLRYLNKLYKEGLLAEDVFTMDRNTITALGENDVPVLGAATGMWTGAFTLSGGEKERAKDYVALEPLEGPKGLKQTTRANYLVYNGRFAITNTCENPEVAIKWVDWLYSYEGYLKQSGVDAGLRDAKPGELNIAGEQAKYAIDEVEDDTPFGMVQNKNWGGTTFGVSYMDEELALLTAVQPETGRPMPNLYQITKEKYLPYAVDKSWKETTLMKTSEDEVRFWELVSLIRDEVNKSMAAFVMGNASIENDWDDYLDRLDKLGLEEMLKLAQKAID